MTSIEANAFVALFNAPGSPVILDVTYVVYGQVRFTAENFRCSYAIISNAMFTEGVFFEAVNLGIGIRFTTCTFKKKISFNRCYASGFDKDAGFDSHSIYFEGCTASQLTFPARNVIERGIRVSNKSKLESFDIVDMYTSLGGIDIEESEVTEKFDLFNSQIKGSGTIRIYNSTIKSSVRITNVVAGGISFHKSRFEKIIHIWSGQLESGLVFNDGVYEDTVYIKAVTNKGGFTISRDDFKKTIQINLEDPTNKITGAQKEIWLSEAQFGNAFILNGANTQIAKIGINCSQNFIGTVKFNSCLVSELAIKGDNHKGNLDFTNCRFTKLSLDHFSNFGNLIFSSCQAIPGEDSSLELRHTNLGKAQWFNFFFNTFRRIQIQDSQFSEIATSGVTWFDDSRLQIGSDAEQQDPMKRREVYRQFKQASEKQGDRIQALHFQAEELGAFHDALARDKKPWNRDRLILTLSRTNDFGLNWTKPLAWTFLITFLFYPILIVCASDKITWAPALSKADLRLTFSEFHYYAHILPQLFNPARGIERMFPKELPLGFGVYAWDALHRVVLAFFILQIVSAFRKYVK